MAIPSARSPRHMWLRAHYSCQHQQLHRDSQSHDDFLTKHRDHAAFEPNQCFCSFRWECEFDLDGNHDLHANPVLPVARKRDRSQRHIILHCLAPRL